MPRTPDGRVLGYFPLQHAGYTQGGWDLAWRASNLAARIIGREDTPGGTDIGHWIYGYDTQGDVHGGQLLDRKIPGGRAISMWRFATPGVTVTGDDVATGGGSGAPPGDSAATGGGGTTTVAVTEPGVGAGAGGTVTTIEVESPAAPNPADDGCRFYGGGLALLPVYYSDGIGDRADNPTHSYSGDKGFKKIKPKQPKIDGEDVWPKFPLGFIGLTLTANNENDQWDLWHPTDPRMVAVQHAGDPTMGSLVCDINEQFGFDPKRQARLQSMMWVIKDPGG